MLVRFKTNLGAVDAEALKLDFKECKCGSEVDVSGDTGEQLVARGWAEVVPEKVRGVAKAAEIVGIKDSPKKGDDK